jgi:hypothetical protein
MTAPNKRAGVGFVSDAISFRLFPTVPAKSKFVKKPACLSLAVIAATVHFCICVAADH